MCENCQNIQVNKKSFTAYAGYDPTHTTGLRNAMVKDLNKRFNIITSLIKKAVIDEDVFGLNDNNIAINAETPGPKAFQFHNSSQKVDAFMKWLNVQVDKTLLETTIINQSGSATNGAWTNMYISDSYKRGVQRARYELKKGGFKVPSIEQTGGIDLSMSTPFHVDRLGILYTRTFNELKGISTAMDTQISRILAQGIGDGDNPRVLAKKLVDAIDGSGKDTLGRPTMSPRRRAEILARTEIINAHHKANVQEYRNWAVEGVVVQAELTTAGDARVCQQCKDLAKNTEGKDIIYTLDEIENLIPVHPQCRCIALPTLPDDEEVPEPVRTKFKPGSDDLTVYENAIRFNKDYETAVVIDSKTGKNIFTKVGDQKSVSFTDKEAEAFTGNVFTHNHPTGAKYPKGDIRRAGFSFSISDLELAMNREIAQMRAVTPEFTFIVEPPPTGWLNFKGQFGTYKLRYEYNTIDEEVGDFISSLISKNRISIEAANVIHHHLVNKRLAKKLGYTYKKIKVK